MILRKLNIVSVLTTVRSLGWKKRDCFCTDGVDQNSEQGVYIIYV